MHGKFRLAECARVFLSGLLLWCVVAPARADSYTWTNTTIGSFSNPANWSPNMVPTAGDDVLLENNYTVGAHTIVFNGQTTASTTAESYGQTTVLQLNGNYSTGPLELYSGGGLVELTGGETLTAQTLGSLDLLVSGANLVVLSSAAPFTCTVDGSGSTFQSGSLQASSFIVTNKAKAVCDSIPNTGGGVYYVDGGGASFTVNGSAGPDPPARIRSTLPVADSRTAASSQEPSSRWTAPIPNCKLAEISRHPGLACVRRW
jgi:hypothetical protein